MKTKFFLFGSSSSISLALLLGAVASLRGAQSPVITDVRCSTSNVIVRVDVPAGVRRLTLESRERLGAGAWSPRAVARLNGEATQIAFTIDASSQAELLRVRADATEALPATFYSGSTSFLNQVEASARMDAPAPNSTTGSTDPASTGSTSGRAVVESDIWKIRGNTLYFFNQLRGLQVIDITDPDHARITGRLPLPAAGEEMYLLGDRFVALLARQGCYYGNDSSVLIVADDAGKPSVVTNLPISGVVQESRMIGSALYVASQSYRIKPGTTNTVWEWGTEVASFDLADPMAPIKRNSLWYSGWGNVVYATDVYLFVATQDFDNWWQSMVHAIDVTSPDGTMSEYAPVRTAGRVLDKFKMNYAASVFTTISEDWHWNGGQLSTKVETFSLADPRSMRPAGIFKLGELEVGNRERLRATRFDGHLVYIVTFFQIDPLWVVDLSNPANPRVAGELQVPGWSTYIEPLGDRLVAVGVETNRVTVSLFDVHNPSAPALLDKVHLGETYSWSEANYNEKAFSVLPDAGLILIPFSGYTSNGYSAQVQLIDLGANSLELRGLIQHRLQPRRATLVNDRVLSVSGWDYVSVDASDRDNPLVKQDLKLAWPIDRILIHGDFLVELSGSPGWAGGEPAGIRITSSSDADDVISEEDLPDLPVLGATIRGNRLYVAQGQQMYWYPIAIPLAGGGDVVDDVGSKFVLSVFALDQLPALPLAGRVETNLTSGSGGEMSPLWLADNLLVFGGSGATYPPYFLGPGLVVGAPIFWRPWYFNSGGHFIAFDVSNDSAPQLASDLTLTFSNAWWTSFSQPFAADGKIFVSHNTFDYIFPYDPVVVPLDATVGVTDGGIVAPPLPIGYSVQRTFLDVIDYADARHPTIRKPVCIPGTLNGIALNGELLYTVGTHWTTNTATGWYQYLDASAYDGVSAHLIDSLPLQNSWPQPLLVKQNNVLIGQPNTSTTVSPSYQSGGLETWTLDANGKFTRLASIDLKNAASLLVPFGDALVVQELDNSVDLFDATDTTRLKLINSGTLPGCLWPDLQHGDATITGGLWSPLGVYGVWHLDGRH